MERRMVENLFVGVKDELNEIRKGVNLLYEPGDLVELRALRDPNDKWSTNIAGFFNNLDTLATAINLVNTEYKRTVYTMMNPVKPGWPYVDNRVYAGNNALLNSLSTDEERMTRMIKRTKWENGMTYYTMRM